MTDILTSFIKAVESVGYLFIDKTFDENNLPTNTAQKHFYCALENTSSASASMPLTSNAKFKAIRHNIIVRLVQLKNRTTENEFNIAINNFISGSLVLTGDVKKIELTSMNMLNNATHYLSILNFGLTTIGV
jgi:hypothetical protein